MPLQIISAHSPRLLDPALVERIRSARMADRPVVLLVPSFAQALDASRELAATPDLSLGITCTTPPAWTRERWEVWGDGRTLVDPAVRAALAYKLVVMDGIAGQSRLSRTKGMAHTLAALVKDVLPWLPAQPDRRISAPEQEVVDLALRYGAALAEHGFIEPCEAMAALPRIFASQQVSMPCIMAAGFADAPFSTVEFLADLSALTQVHVCVYDDGRPQTELCRTFAERLAQAAEARGVMVGRAGSPAEPDEPHGELALLSQALFRVGEKGVVRPTATGAVRIARATGPFAEPELIVAEAARLVDEGARSIVVCSADARTAWDALAPRLAARGLFVQGKEGRRVTLTPACRAFIAFASCVAGLVDAAAAWSTTEPGSLPPMGWWPPRAITDFLISPISGVSEEAAWSLDKRLRGNRALTPTAVLDLLQRESVTSHICAQATRLIMEGRIGSAAHLFARELIEAGADPSSEEIFILETIAQVQASVSHLGLSTSGEGRLSPKDLVELLEHMCTEIACSSSVALGSPEAPATVRIMSRAQAAQLPAGSADSVILMQLTSAEWPLKQADDALALLLGKLSLSAAHDPLALARFRFSRVLDATSGAVVLESSKRDGEGKATYPAVVLTELLACYPEDSALPCRVGMEDAPASKLSASGAAPGSAGTSQLPPQDYIEDRSMLIIPQTPAEASGTLSLSATQIEMYLDCPLKWYTQNRIKIDGIDADFGGMQKGSFAHVVLERTHRELLRRAAVSQGLIPPDGDPEAVAEPFIAGARVTPENLDEATALLDVVFDEHLAGQRERALRKESQSLVPHTASEQYQIDLLRRDLHTVLRFESTRLAGFEPRWFELRFGRGEGKHTVTYAGAQIVGTIDRIDVDERGNAVIIDYKHKNPSNFAAEYNVFPKKGPDKDFSLQTLMLPRHIQTFAYAQIVRRLYPNLNVVGAVYLSTQGTREKDHVLAGLATSGAVTRMLAPKEAAEWEQAMCPPAGTDFGELLDRVEELVAQAIARMTDARIQPEPRDAESCRFCPVLRCERRLG